MLTDQERTERDPAAIQMELLEIEKQRRGWVWFEFYIEVEQDGARVGY